MSTINSLPLCILLTIGCCTAVFPQGISENRIRPYFSAIVVKNAETSSTWYQSLLGLERINVNENLQRGSKIIVLSSEDLLLEIIEVKAQVKREDVLLGKPENTLIQGFTKIGFKVSDMDAYIQKLIELKVNFFGDVYTDPVSGKRSLLIQDPDTNLIQLFE